MKAKMTFISKIVIVTQLCKIIFLKLQLKCFFILNVTKYYDIYDKIIV